MINSGNLIIEKAEIPAQLQNCWRIHWIHPLTFWDHPGIRRFDQGKNTEKERGFRCRLKTTVPAVKILWFSMMFYPGV